METTFNSITANLLSNDVNETVKYYQDVLGFDLVMSVPETGIFVWAMLKKGTTEIMFQSRESIETDVTSFEGKPAGGTLSLYIRVKGIKTLFEALEDRVTIIQPLKVSFYGATEFVMQDLDGYYLMFSEMENQ